MEIEMNKIVFIALIFLSLQANAGDLKSSQDTVKLSNQVMEDFVGKNFKAGIGKIKVHWPLPEVEMDNLLNLIMQQWPIIDQRFGQAIGKEFLYSESIGDSFIRHYYLHKFHNHAIYWKLTFYKPNDTWVVNGVEFLDSLDLLYK
jgi:hypothetical protein